MVHRSCSRCTGTGALVVVQRRWCRGAVVVVQRCRVAQRWYGGCRGAVKQGTTEVQRCRGGLKVQWCRCAEVQKSTAGAEVQRCRGGAEEV